MDVSQETEQSVESWPGFEIWDKHMEMKISLLEKRLYAAECSRDFYKAEANGNALEVKKSQQETEELIKMYDQLKAASSVKMERERAVYRKDLKDLLKSLEVITEENEELRAKLQENSEVKQVRMSGEMHRDAKVSVWWDMKNSIPPTEDDAKMVVTNILTALMCAGYNGLVSIFAYGDMRWIPMDVQNALSSTGISLSHAPAPTGTEGSSSKKMSLDMLEWAIDNCSPANYLLISGDCDQLKVLKTLMRKQYNILLAHSPNVFPLVRATKIPVHLWESFMAGQGTMEPPQ